MKIKFPFLCLASVLAIAACKPESEPAAKKPSSPPPPAPGDTTPVTADPKKTESYIGLDEKAAGAMADKAGLKWRIVEVDGEPRPVTMDHNPDRLNFAIKEGKVIRVTKG